MNHELQVTINFFLNRIAVGPEDFCIKRAIGGGSRLGDVREVARVDSTAARQRQRSASGVLRQTLSRTLWYALS